MVLNFNGLHHQVSEKKWWENLSLWQNELLFVILGPKHRQTQSVFSYQVSGLEVNNPFNDSRLEGIKIPLIIPD